MPKTRRQRKNKKGGLFGWGESNNNGYNNSYGNNSNSGSWFGSLWGSNNSGNNGSWFGRRNNQQPQSYQGMPQDQGYFGGRYRRTKRTKKSTRRTRRHR